MSPALIIFDGHSSRCSGELFSSAMLNNIDLLCLPSHCTHLMQPLDCGCNAAFKNLISKFKVYEDINNEKQKRNHFVEILYNAISSLTFSVIKNAWKTFSLYPPNPFTIL
jgi:hypothetical protein